VVEQQIFIDPSYTMFYSDGLFDLGDDVLNRDDQLLPFHRLREQSKSLSIEMRTADYMFNDPGNNAPACSYYSLGLVENIERVLSDRRAKAKGFVIMEPPVVAPELYEKLPMLSSVFDHVYLHNAHGDGYSLVGVNHEKLRRFYWPIPYRDVREPYWSNVDRMKRVVVINGSHNPHGRHREQYSLRIKAMVELSKDGIVDLYGKGWHRWWSRSAMWASYWYNRRTLMSIYKGPCKSKFELLSKYQFCLCFENMNMDGYITEKIFDCLYAGCIPLYLGAPDILDYVPAEAFVDCRQYGTWGDMWKDVAAMTPARIATMKLAGRNFLQSDIAKRFYDSMEHVVLGS
jgi:hypothetical protein